MVVKDNPHVTGTPPVTPEHLLPRLPLKLETFSFVNRLLQTYFLVVSFICMFLQVSIHFLHSIHRSVMGNRAAAKNHIFVDPGEWLRPLGSMENYMLQAGYMKSMNTIQAIWLSSSQPINPIDVRNALMQVAQKTQILQTCVQQKKWRPWFRRMKEVVCDFDVLEGDVMEVFYSQIPLPYDIENGPLWRARLVNIPPESPNDPYQACFIFCMQHCITDGYSNMRIFRDLLKSLNSSMTGRVHELPVRPLIPAVIDSLEPKRAWYNLFIYYWTRVYKTVIADRNIVYFSGILKQPQTSLALTKILRENFTPEETRELIRHCKAAGVTINSCIMATANLALLLTVQQRAKNTVETARITSVNSVDMRRYFPNEIKDSFGCHISVDEKELQIPSSAAKDKESFWSLVKVFQDHMHESLNVNYMPIKLAALCRFATVLLRLNNSLTRHGLKNTTDHHIQSTNMGNLKHLLPAKYDGPVEITDLLRSGSCDLTGGPFTLTFHTFNDRFMVSVSYFTNKITDEDATQFHRNLVNYINNIARYGTVTEPVASLNIYSSNANETEIESKDKGFLP